MSLALFSSGIDSIPSPTHPRKDSPRSSCLHVAFTSPSLRPQVLSYSDTSHTRSLLTLLHPSIALPSRLLYLPALSLFAPSSARFLCSRQVNLRRRCTDRCCVSALDFFSGASSIPWRMLSLSGTMEMDGSGARAPSDEGSLNLVVLGSERHLKLGPSCLH